MAARSTCRERAATASIIVVMMMIVIVGGGGFLYLFAFTKPKN
ncbi:MAG TPA: hypothetical protein VID24_05180 [Candidatus Eremiobacteraceae bacterium]